MTDLWADVRKQLVEDLGEMFAERFDRLPDGYKPSFIDVLAFLRGDTLAPEMTAMNVAESRMERDALLVFIEDVLNADPNWRDSKAYATLPEHLRE